MPVLLGVQICTTTRSSRAGAIIAKMENLLDARREYKVTRRGFLDKWRRLRTALFLTQDYQDLITRVCERAKGKCQVCGERSGSHVHHIEPVAFSPKLVLLDINCKWCCKECHPAEDKKSRATALERANKHTERRNA